MISKNEEYIVKIIDHGINGQGIAKIDGFTVFISNAIKNEILKIKILKVTNSHAFGKIIEIIEKSEYRKIPDCDTYNKCGGCVYRHLDYNSIFNIKKISVENTLKKTLGKEIKVDETIPMENPYYYRNKLQYPVSVNAEGKPVMGIFAERSHRVIPTEDCKIQNILCQNIANDIYRNICQNDINVYNEKNEKGSIRHIVIRIGIKTNEVMVILVTKTKKIKNEKKLVEYITNKYSEIKTIVKNVNTKNTNVILGDENITLYGTGYIYDYLENYKFKISPMSFYQVNPIQTQKLYNKAIEYAELTGEEVIFDLYCGIGTIGIFASKKVKKVYGIETIPEAIKDAKENAKINDIKNSEFFAGDVELTLPQFIKERNIFADVIFVDPPRKGCELKALETIMKIMPKKIVYISCNPATLARDLKILENKYEIKKISICDMFPFTSHVECLAVMELKSSL